jgi:hypothetical protein
MFSASRPWMSSPYLAIASTPSSIIRPVALNSTNSAVSRRIAAFGRSR